MKDALAEKLLAKVLGWSAEDIARERPLLQAMAAFKYDEYEQYSPGMRFVESLARWLRQFEEADRAVAYSFMKERLIFCSSHEMNHLVETAYPDHIRPILLERVAIEHSLSPYHVGQLVASSAFRVMQRQCLFLGLSDGARIDAFRRANRDLNHEQIWQTHELSPDRVKELMAKLLEHAQQIDQSVTSPTHFRTIVLLDDFSASGSSYILKKADASYGGKVVKFLEGLKTEPRRSLCHPDGIDLVILIYMATEKAIDYLRTTVKGLASDGINQIRIETVQPIPQSITLLRGEGGDFGRLIEKYYDQSVFDTHLQKGNTPDAKYGYADCGLPVVLHHNTPNNSVALLWSYEGLEVRGLFPRVQRHKEMS